MHSGSRFVSTQWSLVLAAPENPALLESLLNIYLGPIYAYIRRAEPEGDRAADLTQEFVSQIILQRGLLERADPSRGRFRTFLKSALANFLVDQHRRATTRARRPGTPVLNGLRLDQIEPLAEDDPDAAFDRQWATTLLATTLTRLEADCIACHQELHWRAFLTAVLQPSLRHTTPPSMPDLARQLGLSSGDQASSMIQTVRRKFRRFLERTVSETVVDQQATGEEMARVREFLRDQ
jgi:RNA polymerase sigma-70 factor (ECF subfamily)